MLTTKQLQLDEMIRGYWLSQAIYAAAKFGIADLLQAGPRSVEDLAASTGTHAGALYRLLRALASVGIFAEEGDRRFAITELAECLRADVPGSKRALALMSGDEQFRAWAEIEYSLRTGQTAFEKVYGEPVFDYLSKHPDKASIFDGAMVGIHGRESGAIAEAYDFSGLQILADIGGGNGSQLTAILQRHPHLRGILFDLPHVIERARERLTSAGMLNRCELVSGSFFDSVPPGADAYLMRHIIHDWDETKCHTILQNCHRAMTAKSKLLVVESVIPSGNGPFGGKILDLVMLLIPGGQERTEDEYRSLFQQANFRLTRVLPTASEVSIIEAERES